MGHLFIIFTTYISHSSEVWEVQDQGADQKGFILRSLLFAYMRPSFHCGLIWPLCEPPGKTASSLVTLLVRTLIPSGGIYPQDPTLPYMQTPSPEGFITHQVSQLPSFPILTTAPCRVRSPYVPESRFQGQTWEETQTHPKLLIMSMIWVNMHGNGFLRYRPRTDSWNKIWWLIGMCFLEILV